jgi:hypothetical protein
VKAARSRGAPQYVQRAAALRMRRNGCDHATICLYSVKMTGTSTRVDLSKIRVALDAAITKKPGALPRA